MPDSSGPAELSRAESRFDRIGRQAFVVAMGGLALLAAITPLLRAEVVGRLGVILIAAAMLEAAHAFRRAVASSQQDAWMGALMSLGVGILLLNSPFLATSGLLVAVAGWFVLAGVKSLLSFWSARQERPSLGRCLFFMVANFTAAGLVLMVRGEVLEWMLALAAAFHLLQTAGEFRAAVVLTARDSGTVALESLGVGDVPELHQLASEISEQEQQRAAIDRGWIIGFLVTLFAIHLGRMGFDQSFLGVISPVVAVAGDLAVALLLAFVVIVPVSVTWRRLTRPLERRAWALCRNDGNPIRWWQRMLRIGLVYRLRCSIRLQQASYSAPTALSRGLQIGLPLTAVLVATVPVWGMSWYFDTENWAAGVWNSWAAERTDVWREAMAEPLWPGEQKRGPAEAFAINPGVFDRSSDFAFLVIGDTGEGDASQLSLKASLLDAAGQEEVKFVIISSDVIYPTGAMRNYELNFWLPFMGVTKPVYAIPGNHDWYDALDAFVATFFEPEAARVALEARVDADAGVSSTTDARIEQLIGIATRLQKNYGVPTFGQRAPYFQFQTPTFALFAVDTGVERTIDPIQWQWLEAGLKAAAGKTKMALLGHPFYAGGQDVTGDEESGFARLRRLLEEHQVAIVMAGDTHDLEYYEQPSADREETVRHFVNGGGGAYLSFGTALAWPKNPATSEWAYYPGRKEVVSKIELTTPAWKRPAWWWTKYFGAWPFSAEWLSAAFDVNSAPFMQSFVVVHVEPSRRRIRIVPYGIGGRLRWRDFDRAAGDTIGDDFAEWVIPFAKASE